ncbi:MAG: hypothetical protein N2652_06945 [Kiritimatiellae bacterium]|nr:hypothetical protein [Kiritimatiellia bacterium]
MTLRRNWAGWVGVLALLAGCAGRETPEAIAEREELRALVAKLERRVGELQAEIETMRAERTTELKATVQDMLRVELDSMIQTTVYARVEAKLGDKAQVDRMVRETVMETLAAVEAQRRAEEEARRERERLEREQRRAQFEEERWNRTAQELKLNEAQKEQMRAVNQAIRSEIETMMAQARESGQMPDPAAIRQAAQELKTKYETALAQVLTPEQITAYRNQPFNLLRMLDAMAGGEGGPGFFMRRGGGDDDRRRGPPR